MTPAQLLERKRFIGGSDCSAALNLNPWKTAFELWQEKSTDSEPGETSEAMRWGTLLEPVIRQEYSERTRRVVRIPDTLLVHPVHPFIVGHVDGVTDDGRLLEVKTSRSTYGWGTVETDAVPQHYLLQVQHYLVLTALPVADVAVLIAGSDYRQYEIPADIELQEMIVEGELEFWHCVESGEPPPLDLDSPRALAIVRKLYAGTSGEILTATDHLEHWRAVYDDAYAATERYQGVADGAKAHLLHAMGEAAELRFADGKALRRRLQRRKAYTVNYPETSFIDSRFVSFKD